MAEKATAAYHKVEDTVVGGYKKVENTFVDIEYVKGDFEPIISEELWTKCESIRKGKITKFRICVLLALVCILYIGLTLLFVDVVQNRPPAL